MRTQPGALRARGGAHDLLLHTGDPPGLDVARAVGLLRVDDADVRPVGGDGGELLAGERTRDAPYLCPRGEIGSPVAAQDAERQVRGAGRPGGGHPRVRVLLELE